jgi:hypothetical protein
MPAWAGKQNPAAIASKINGQTEGINQVPFPLISPPWRRVWEGSVNKFHLNKLFDYTGCLGRIN